MATKKEKRAAGEIRSENHRADSIESGLKAQNADREDRQRRATKSELAAEKQNKRLENLKKLHTIMGPESFTPGS